jgi:hypothetical protein
MSGIPSGSSVASSEQPYPVYMAFSWVPMVLDDQVVGRLGGPRLWESCRQPQFRATHDDDQEGDGRGSAPRDWRRNISARGRPFDDLSHTSSHGAQQHTRSPHVGGRCHGGIGVSAQDQWANRCLALLCATVLISRIVVMMGIESIVRLYLHGFTRWPSLRACLVA